MAAKERTEHKKGANLIGRARLPVALGVMDPVAARPLPKRLALPKADERVLSPTVQIKKQLQHPVEFIRADSGCLLDQGCPSFSENPVWLAPLPYPDKIQNCGGLIANPPPQMKILRPLLKTRTPHRVAGGVSFARLMQPRTA